MEEELPEYDDRLDIHQPGIARQPARGGVNTRLVAQIMTVAAEDEYRADCNVPEVKYSGPQ